jgi:16S rRNA (uracil1498-N3)-methyltransferase
MSRRSTSNTYRFFVPPSSLHGGQFLSTDAKLIHQLSNVLRLQVGDQITLLDGLGNSSLVELTALERKHIVGIVQHSALATGEPQLQLTLYIGLMRAERCEWLLQKATELGVTQFVPMLTERTQRAEAGLSAAKRERWERIIREAAEQARRSRLPQLTPPVDFTRACQSRPTDQVSLLLWEGSGVVGLRTLLTAQPPSQGYAVFSGPEGGFSSGELEIAREHGIIPVSLGPRTLRAETAPLAAATALLYHCGELE